ncbi:porin [Sedimentitalea sp. HM32M-2]|uniref:porin n=1 Tax=Sedimentitalea sp. HM32M-2 TaxID=3351566 RepID=UPI003626B4B0
MTKLLSRPLAAAAVMSLTAPAMAEMKYENATGGSALAYGQLDPAYLSFDDGVSTTSDIVDNTNSNSRVGLWLRQDYGANKFSFNFETALGLRPSAGLSQATTPKGVDWDRTDIRKVDFSLQTASAGTFFAGQGSMSTDGVAESDLSGTSLITYSSVPDTAGSFVFRTAAGALSTRSIGGSFGNFDGARLGRVRYDTPTFSGFTLSASWGTNILSSQNDSETAAIALRYAGDFGDYKMRGAIGYSSTKPGGGASDFDDTIGSFSVLHSSGINFTLAGGDRSTAGNYGYGKLGYLASWFSVGSTALSVDYYRGSDQSGAGSKSKSIGFGAVQKFDNANIEAYLGYRTYELTETAASYQDASSIMFGARWKF